jgi:hypothetical protein
LAFYPFLIQKEKNSGKRTPRRLKRLIILLLISLIPPRGISVVYMRKLKLNNIAPSVPNNSFINFPHTPGESPGLYEEIKIK